MAKTREIRGRMKAVGNIQRITKTMQMIATARFQASLRNATSAKPYTQGIAELVRELTGSLQNSKASNQSGDGGERNFDHPLLRPPPESNPREVVLVLTSNRGLCGGYNANILRTASGYLGQRGDARVDLEVVGKKGLAYFKFMGRPVTEFHSQFTDTPRFEVVEALAQRYMAGFKDREIDVVKVVYMSFESVARQKPAVAQLLPLSQPESAADGASGRGQGVSRGVMYETSPSPAELLGELLPVVVKTSLFQFFNEAAVSEHIARMVAMKSATDAAGKMKKSLTRKYNRARQTAITTELSEIIGGSAALQ